MAAEHDVVIIFVFTGEDGSHILPDNVTHLIIHESVTVIPSYLCYEHKNIIEVYCHVGVKIIEEMAFAYCPRLRRLIIPGVEIVGDSAFIRCEAVTDVDCPKLEIIEQQAFGYCESLGSIHLPSAKIVERAAFVDCETLMEAKFGKNLESIGGHAFFNCPRLERITIPLKHDIVTFDGVFQGCRKFQQVDLVEREVLDKTIAALELEEWRNTMNIVIQQINHILPSAPAGDYEEEGDKATEINLWITTVLDRIACYKAKHRRILKEAASGLQHALPNDIIMNSVLSFLELPQHTFEGEDRYSV